jgi:hypothetical protein
MLTPTAMSGSISLRKKSSSAATPSTAGRPSWPDSYPFDWIRTLDAVEKLDFEQALGGHGDVMRGKGKFEMWKSYFRDLLDQTAEAYSNGASLEQAQSQVSKALIAKYAARFDPNFAQSVNANIAKAYQVIAMAR